MVTNAGLAVAVGMTTKFVDSCIDYEHRIGFLMRHETPMKVALSLMHICFVVIDPVYAAACVFLIMFPFLKVDTWYWRCGSGIAALRLSLASSSSLHTVTSLAYDLCTPQYLALGIVWVVALACPEKPKIKYGLRAVLPVVGLILYGPQRDGRLANVMWCQTAYCITSVALASFVYTATPE